MSSRAVIVTCGQNGLVEAGAALAAVVKDVKVGWSGTNQVKDVSPLTIYSFLNMSVPKMPLMDKMAEQNGRSDFWPRKTDCVISEFGVYLEKRANRAFSGYLSSASEVSSTAEVVLRSTLVAGLARKWKNQTKIFTVSQLLGLIKELATNNTESTLGVMAWVLNVRRKRCPVLVTVDRNEKRIVLCVYETCAFTDIGQNKYIAFLL